MTIPKKVERRISQAFLKLRPLLEEAKKRDVNEADTVTLVKAVLSDAFGWDPFFEVTSEFAIRSTYVDLAVQTDNQVGYLIEVKAIGSDLRDNHLRQAVNYAANHGVDWVVLTNGAVWQAFRVTFGKPIGHELVFDLDLLSANPKDARVRETAFLLSKEGMTKSAITQFHAEKQAMSRFNVAAIIRSDAVMSVVRRELKRAFPVLKPTIDQVRELVEAEVLKREVVEGDKAMKAERSMKKVNRPLRQKRPAARRSELDGGATPTTAPAGGGGPGSAPVAEG
jgi:predicted type IV restriction endonuclease